VDRARYFDFMRETSAAVYPFILRRVEKTREVNVELHKIVSFFVQKKMEAPSLKAAIVRLGYEVCGGMDWKSVAPVAAAFELINISSYQANSAFDAKLGIFERAARDAQFMAAMITRELALRVAHEMNDRQNKELVLQVQDALSLSNRSIYIAQHFELNLLKVDRLDEYAEEHVFQDHYLRRCHYGSGIINGQCAYVGGLLAGGCSEWLRALRHFGEEFGVALQIVNDLGDFIPRDDSDRLARCFQDRYSDFKNGRLTAPLYHALKLGGRATLGKVKDILDSHAFDEESLLEVTTLLAQEGSFSYALALARQAAKRAKGVTAVLPKGNGRALLLTMLSIIHSNKYLAELRRIASCLQADASAEIQELAARRTAHAHSLPANQEGKGS